MYVFLRFYVFFKIPKKHDFLRFFELLHTFSRTSLYNMDFSLQLRNIFTKQEYTTQNSQVSVFGYQYISYEIIHRFSYYFKVKPPEN